MEVQAQHLLLFLPPFSLRSHPLFPPCARISSPFALSPLTPARLSLLPVFLFFSGASCGGVPFFPVNFLLLRGQLFSRYSPARCFLISLILIIFFPSLSHYGRYSLTLRVIHHASVTLHRCSLMQEEGYAIRSVKLPRLPSVLCARRQDSHQPKWELLVKSMKVHR